MSQDDLARLDELRFFESSRILLSMISRASKEIYPLHPLVAHQELVQALANPQGVTFLEKFDFLKTLVSQRDFRLRLEQLLKELDDTLAQYRDNILAMYDSSICQAIILFLMGRYRESALALDKLYRSGIFPGEDGFEINRSARAILAIWEEDVLDVLLYHSFNAKLVSKYSRLVGYDAWSSMVSYVVGIARESRKVDATRENLLAHAVFVFELMMPTAEVGLANEEISNMKQEVAASLNWLLSGFFQDPFNGCLGLALLLRAKYWNSHVNPDFKVVLDKYSISELARLASLRCERAGFQDLSLISKIVDHIESSDFKTAEIDSLRQIELLLEDAVKQVNVKRIVDSYSLQEYVILRNHVLKALSASAKEQIERFKTDRSQVFQEAGITDQLVKQLVLEAANPGGALHPAMEIIGPQEKRSELARELADLVALKRDEGVLELSALVHERARVVSSIEQRVRKFEQSFGLPNPRPVISYFAPPIPLEVYSLLSYIAGVLSTWAIGKGLDIVYKRACKTVDFTEEDRSKIKAIEKRLAEVDKTVREMKDRIDEAWRKGQAS